MQEPLQACPQGGREGPGEGVGRARGVGRVMGKVWGVWGAWGGWGAWAAPRDRVRQLNLGEKIPGGGRGHEGRRGLAGGTGVRGGQAHTGHGVFLKKMFKHDIVTQPCSSKN